MNNLSRQAAVVPLNDSFNRDQMGSMEQQPSFDTQGDSIIAEVGQTIPIVFCKRVSEVGGAFVIPSLVRYGLQNSNDSAVFSNAYLVSEGQITSPLASVDDALIGGFKSSDLDGLDSLTPTFTFGALPTSDYVYGVDLTTQYDFKTNTYTNQGPVTLGGDLYVLNPVGVVPDSVGSGSFTATSSLPFCTFLSVTLQSTNFNRRVSYSVTTEVFNGSGTLLYEYVNSRTDTSSIGRVTGFTFLTTVDGEEVDSGTTPSITKSYSIIDPADAGSVSITLSLPLTNPLEYDDDTTGPIQQTYSDFSTVDEVYFQYTEQLRPPFLRPDAINNYSFPVYRDTTAGDFSGLTILGVRGRIGLIQGEEVERRTDSSQADIDNFNTLYNGKVLLFCSNGINVTSVLTGTSGPSNNIADLINYLASKFVSSISINQTDLQTTANFTNANGLFFNGALLSSVNFKEWLETIAPYFLLTPVNLESQISALPALPLSGNSLKTSGFTPAATFTSASIAEGSYSVEYVPLNERRPFEAVMLWRDQGLNAFNDRKPINKTVKVKYAADTGDLPQEQYDMSEFCVTQAHAVLAAKYILAKRRRITHTASFTVDVVSTQGLRPGSLIAVELQRTTDDGNSRTETNYYLIDTISRSVTGTAQITGEYFPIEGGASLISGDITSGSFTITT